jgi:hypothetical protein
VLGIVIVAENEPDELATILAGVVVSVVVPSFIVIVAPTVKPVPEIVTVVPTTPELGESVIEVATTVNVAD